MDSKAFVKVLEAANQVALAELVGMRTTGEFAVADARGEAVAVN